MTEPGPEPGPEVGAGMGLDAAAYVPGAARRCPWADSSPLMRTYHDTEWGRPQRDERHLFEMLLLEGAQAGLSWASVLTRREGYRAAYDAFDPAAIAAWSDAHVEELLTDTRIIRNRAKVNAARTNAAAMLALVTAQGPFAAWLWGRVDGSPVVMTPQAPGDVLVTSDLGDALSRDLRRWGFTFVGPTIVHSFLQAVGVVDEHLVGCPAKPSSR